MEATPIYNATEFNYSIIRKIPEQKRKKGNPACKDRFYYKDVVCAFDIETTNIPFCDASVMYIWQFQLGHYATIIGRTWKEFQHMCAQIAKYLWSEQRLYIAVHNLSFEFQFLSGIYDFKVEEVFAVKSRKILRCSMLNNKLQFNCSYLHSNMSLLEYTSKMDVEHVKLSGEEFNYNRIRFPWTPLTQKEIDYCVFDVIGLVEAIEKEMEIDGDNLYSFPLTSTGYVRRDVKNAMRKAGISIKHLLPDLDTYKMCRKAFRGGDTHANRYYANTHLYNLYSEDRSSSYPDVICNCKFPMSKFVDVENPTRDDMIDRVVSKEKACLIEVSFTGIELRNKYYGNPYLSRDKCENIMVGVYDNGRILSANYLETTITDVDMRIILDIYKFKDCKCIKLKTARYDYLPQPIIDVNIDYYRRKTQLKGIPNQEIYYVKSKNKLNSVYGCMAQDPCKQSIDYIHGEYIEHKDDLETLLEKSNKKAFLSYTWAPWVTAWARYRLYEGIKLVGDGHVYNDTDSVKHLNKVDFTEYNNKRIADSKKSGAYAVDSKGIIHYMGVYETEHNMSDFATLGAKKYCFIEEGSSELKVTISGVTKSKGGKELMKYDGIETFLNTPFTFREAGGLDAVYDDNRGCRIVEIDGYKLPITANVQLVPSTYTLGITGEYERLLKGLRVV